MEKGPKDEIERLFRMFTQSALGKAAHKNALSMKRGGECSFFPDCTGCAHLKLLARMKNNRLVISSCFTQKRMNNAGYNTLAAIAQLKRRYQNNLGVEDLIIVAKDYANDKDLARVLPYKELSLKRKSSDEIIKAATELLDAQIVNVSTNNK